LDSKESYQIRPAEACDAGIIARQRAAMFRDMGLVSPEEGELLRSASEPWVAALLSNGGYFGWLVEYDNVVVAGGGIIIRELPPTPGCYRIGRWGNIMSVYTEPTHRRRGLARRLMETILAWCGSHAIDQVTLAASDEGRPLYEAMGFVPTSEMKLPVERISCLTVG
jgi:GNAT superfamily N-acetyltransferase